MLFIVFKEQVNFAGHHAFYGAQVFGVYPDIISQYVFESRNGKFDYWKIKLEFMNLWEKFMSERANES